jgi:kumamolisin
MKPSRKYAIPALLTLTVLTTVFLLFYGVVGASPAPPARNPIPGHTIPALAGRTPLGATDGQQKLQLTISLNLADGAGLQSLISAQNDRQSPLYHHYLTPQQFGAHYAPSPASVDAVVSWLRSQGLTVQSVATNRLSIKVEGTVSTVEQAFSVRIENYSLDGHVVYAPTSNPSVPTWLSRLILNVGGLDNTSAPHRLDMLAPKPGSRKPAAGSGPGGGYTPSELRTAYDMNSLVTSDDGSGQTVALVELDGYRPGDVNIYLSQYGLGSAKYSNVLLDGATGQPSASGGAIEVELDMEVVSAIAPGAAQKVYMAPNTAQGFLDIFNQIVTDGTAKVTTNSWGLCESLTGSANMQAFDTVFAQGAAQGQAFFSASGDAGSADCQRDASSNTGLSVDYPASDPFVVGVGGTSLTTGSGGSYSGESVWNNSSGSDGGGLSTFFAQPSYQSGPGVSNAFSNGKREVPDVSADADPNTGYSEYCTDPLTSGCAGVGWIEVGGTSGAAPLWAGVAADLNEYLAGQNKPVLGSASARLYHAFNTPQALTAYHDIIVGNNDNNGLNHGDYPATSGYDLASGVGTPDVWNLAQDIAGVVPGVSPTSIQLMTTPGVNPAPQTITIQNNSQNTFNWSLGTLPAWLSAAPSSGSIAAHGSGTFTLSFIIGATPQTYTTTLLVQDTGSVYNPLPVAISVVSSGISKTWYFAEGYTGGSFTEYLTIANPNPSVTTVTVQYLLQGAAPITRSYQVSANSRFTLNVNGQVGTNRNVSMVVTGSQPIIAERPMYFTYTGLPGYSIPGGSDVLGATSLATDFDFGYLDTTRGHDTYLTILNQNTSTMQVTVSYFRAAGGAPIIRTHSVAANSRGTVHVNGDGLPAGTYSALVHLSEPGLVERPLYLVDGSTGYTGSADVVGVSQPQSDWYFAEGYISSTFQERYIVSNPSTSASSSVTLTFFLSSGTPRTTSFTLAPGQQRIFNAGSLLSGNNSAHVSATAPVLAERFMSFKYLNQIPGASDVLGAVAPSGQFYFAEGYTGGQFSEYLTIENPNTSGTATVHVTFLPATGGAPRVQTYSVAASSRFTLNTASVMPKQSFSMEVTANIPIVAERPMYFIYTGNQTGGTDVIGYQPAGTIPAPPPPPPPGPPTTVYSGSTDGYEYALTPTTGILDWKYQTSGGVSTACFASGVTYFGSSDGYFYAINASTGILYWRSHLGASSYPASAVVNGAVYVAAQNGTVYALNSTTGSAIWSYPTGGTIGAAPTVANGIVYVSVESKGITALTASAGTVAWSYAEQYVIDTTPAVDNGMVYFISTGDGRLHALNATTGGVVWTYIGLGSTGASLDSPAAVNGVVYAIDTVGGTYAFNDLNGTKLWNTPIPANGAYVDTSAPAVANGIVYVGDQGSLYAYNASDGSTLWHYQTGGAVRSVATVAANGTVYFGSDDSYIYALNASTGVLVWRYQTGGQVPESPVVAP